MDPGFWRGRRVLVTGHTGFKGAWLTLWLHLMGADVRGLAGSTGRTRSLFTLSRLGDLVTGDVTDIRDFGQVSRAVADSEAEVILHLASRAILRQSIEDPLDTYSVNVLGTANVLEAVRRARHDVGAVVCVTSDKCYQDRDWEWGYRETDSLGGNDPYSSSKACQELVVAAYRRSLLGGRTPVATARAGNVIGGGDWGQDRLVPDVMRAALADRPVDIRSPHSVRAWQHVLDPLCGYLTLAQRLCSDGTAFADAWNFAPAPEDARPVSWLVDRIRRGWPQELDVRVADPPSTSIEAHRMRLDCSRARETLRWRPTWSAARSVDATLEWYAAYSMGGDVRATTVSQIQAFQQDLERDAGGRALPGPRSGPGSAHTVEPEPEREQGPEH